MNPSSLIPSIWALLTFTAVAEIEVKKDIPYLGADRSEKMDAYLPEKKFPRPLPAVIWIHGGAWISGSKSAKRELNICRTLAENGYAAFSIDYHLGKDEPGAAAPWPENIGDCKSALRFIRKEAATFGIDPARIAVSGGSAGGHLALVLGLSADDATLNQAGLYTDQSNAVSCIIDFYGPTYISEEKRIVKFAGKTPGETAANVAAASPLNQIRKDSPPIFIAHGTNDKLCDIQYSRDLVTKMKATGSVYQYLEVQGAGHSFDFQPPQMDLRPAVLAFLAKYLKAP